MNEINGKNWIQNKSIRFVYLLYTDIGYRIGSTKDLNNRISNVKLPFDFHRVRVYGTKNHKILEDELFNIFNNKRLDGDWFDLSSSDIDNAEKIIEASYDMLILESKPIPKVTPYHEFLKQKTIAHSVSSISFN